MSSSVPSRCLDGYVEAQVHGGIDLAHDVEAIVLDPSFAGINGVVKTRSIGVAARRVHLDMPLPRGDPAESDHQQLKYLWHTLLAYGHDAVQQRW